MREVCALRYVNWWAGQAVEIHWATSRLACGSTVSFLYFLVHIYFHNTAGGIFRNRYRTHLLSNSSNTRLTGNSMQSLPAHAHRGYRQHTQVALSYHKPFQYQSSIPGTFWYYFLRCNARKCVSLLIRVTSFKLSGWLPEWNWFLFEKLIVV